MGLAASQARLLFITARQNDVSAQMQRISNQTLTLARDEEEVSDTYNQMLTATTLKTSDGVDLSYDALMGATGAESGKTSASIITQASSGKVALKASDVTAWGLPATGNKGDITKIYSNAKAFVKAVTGSDEVAAAVTETTNIDNNGSSVLTDALKAKLKTFKSTYGSYPTTSNPVEVQSLLGDATASISTWTKTHNDNYSTSYNLLDLAKGGTDGDIIINLADDDSAGGVPRTEAKNNIKNLSDAIIVAIAKSMGIKDTSNVKSLMESTVNELVKTVDSLNDSNNRSKYYSGAGPATDNALRNSANPGQIGMIAEGCAHSGTDRDFFKVNASTLTKYLFQKMMSMYGADVSDTSGVSRNGSTYDAKGIDFDADKLVTYSYNSKGYNEETYKQKLKAYANLTDAQLTDEVLAYLGKTADDSDTVTEPTNDTKASYYTSIYNALNSNGWVTDSIVEDASSLSEAIKNGTYKVNNNSGKDSGYFQPVADSETRANAQHYYDDEMKKINRKEKILDQQLTKLQTEYSALTNDYESVKSIINANVQKSFTYCQQG